MAASVDLIESVANENNKVGAGAPAFFMNTVLQQHASHLARIQTITEQALQGFTTIHSVIIGKLAQAIIEMDPTEALANAVIGQQGTKVAQSTPPETAVPATVVAGK